jgi:hypothetical protein
MVSKPCKMSAPDLWRTYQGLGTLADVLIKSVQVLEQVFCKEQEGEQADRDGTSLGLLRQAMSLLYSGIAESRSLLPIAIRHAERLIITHTQRPHEAAEQHGTVATSRVACLNAGPVKLGVLSVAVRMRSHQTVYFASCGALASCLTELDLCGTCGYRCVVWP